MYSKVLSLKFDESNGSEVEQVDPSVVGGIDPSEAIKTMTTRDIAPTNDFVPIPSEESSPSQDVPSTSTKGQQGSEPQDQVPPSSQH